MVSTMNRPCVRAYRDTHTAASADARLTAAFRESRAPTLLHAHPQTDPLTVPHTSVIKASFGSRLMDVWSHVRAN